VTVYLVGAGPGDPGLITAKGLDLVRSCEALVYDVLVAPELVAEAPDDALLIPRAKLKQSEINKLLVELGQRGLEVVRLKGGDPFVFGRGGEEAEALVDAGIPFEVVPGVSTPLGIAAYSGVPLTHRQHTSAVTFVTGHEVDKIDWAKVGHAATLVIFMGLTTFDRIAAELIAKGRAADTPAMVVRWGTRPDQETLTGTIETLPALIRERGLKPPATIVVGEVVRLREKLNWYEHLPLFGTRIVVTRAREQADTLSVKLRDLGADVVELPTIAIEPAMDYSALDAAICNLEQFDWLIFTSANGVKYFLDRLDASTVDLRKLRAKICAIGPATRKAVEALHLKVDLMGKEYVAESLVEAFAAHDLEGK
jgi:uroporphyrinogen III methyltransferase / synthase